MILPIIPPKVKVQISCHVTHLYVAKVGLAEKGNSYPSEPTFISDHHVPLTSSHEAEQVRVAANRVPRMACGKHDFHNTQLKRMV